MKETQIQFVKRHLLDYGEISRNYCLQNFITRLASIIPILHNQGFITKADYRKTQRGKDFVYTLISAPYKKVVYRVPETDKEIITYEKT